MVTTVAALVIVLGLMVSLARHVRNASAVELTKSVLRRIDRLMSQYEATHPPPAIAPVVMSDADLRRVQSLMGFKLPRVREFLVNVADPPNTELYEHVLEKAALENNRQFVAVLRSFDAGKPQSMFSRLSGAVYDGATLRDAWGMPIVYMPAMHPAIGMAPQNKRFFFSAGPGHTYLTQDDNLYSYEEAGHPE